MEGLQFMSVFSFYNIIASLNIIRGFVNMYDLQRHHVHLHRIAVLHEVAMCCFFCGFIHLMCEALSYSVKY